MIKALPILLLLPVLLAPLSSHGADIPFGIDLKELERPKPAVPAGQKREKTKKEGRSGKRNRSAGKPARTARTARTAASKPATDGNLGHTVKPEERVAPPAPLWICQVPEQDPAAAIDSLLALLQVSAERNKAVEAGQKPDAALTIIVDRYFEYKGGRYIVSIGASDPPEYTRLRLLEAAGHKVLRLSGVENYRGATDSLLRAVGVAPDFGRHPLQEGKGITGFLIKAEAAGGKRVVVSAERVEPGEKWLLAPECGAR